MFYGIQLKAGQSQQIQAVPDHDQFVLTQAVLAEGQNVNLLINGITFAQLNQRNQHIHLNCRITPELKETTISATGNGTAHLCGYWIALEQKSDDEEIDNAVTVAQLLRQSNPLPQTKAKVPQQKKWDECDWEDEEFLQKVK